jgi:hypothetical protein
MLLALWSCCWRYPNHIWSAVGHFLHVVATRASNQECACHADSCWVTHLRHKSTCSGWHSNGAARACCWCQPHEHRTKSVRVMLTHAVRHLRRTKHSGRHSSGAARACCWCQPHEHRAKSVRVMLTHAVRHLRRTKHSGRHSSRAARACCWCQPHEHRAKSVRVMLTHAVRHLRSARHKAERLALTVTVKLDALFQKRHCVGSLDVNRVMPSDLPRGGEETGGM